MSDPAPDTPPASDASQYLNEVFIDLMQYIERYHATNGFVPDDKAMAKRFDIAPATLEEFKVDPLVQKSLRVRGINYPGAKEFLNDRQLSAIAMMTDYTDKRSNEKKLRDIGITSREWSTWLLDENFAGYLAERAERMFAGSQHEAHLGLIKGMRNGNVASVKLYNEMTGRYNPDADNQFNIRMLMSGIIEILQTEIQDPIALHRIATKMMNLAAREQNPSAIAGGLSGRYAPPTVISQKEIEMVSDL